MSKKRNSRWGKNGQRYSTERKVEDTRWTKDKHGQWRLAIDQVSEVKYVERRREKAGWHKGARVRKVA